MKDQVLSIERMQHLEELGLDTSKASMYWVRIVRPATRLNEKERVMLDWTLYLSKKVMHTQLDVVRTIPTFTLQDILDLLPKEIYAKDRTYKHLHVDFIKQIVYYGTCDDSNYEIYKEIKILDGNLIYALFTMLRWCIEQGYVETKKEE